MSQQFLSFFGPPGGATRQVLLQYAVQYTTVVEYCLLDTPPSGCGMGKPCGKTTRKKTKAAILLTLENLNFDAQGKQSGGTRIGIWG